MPYRNLWPRTPAGPEYALSAWQKKLRRESFVYVVFLGTGEDEDGVENRPVRMKITEGWHAWTHEPDKPHLTVEYQRGDWAVSRFVPPYEVFRSRKSSLAYLRRTLFEQKIEFKEYVQETRQAYEEACKRRREWISLLGDLGLTQ